jgi:RNA-directed DNA polymerase
VPQLDRLKSAESLSDLARLLGFTPRGLSYVLYKTELAQKYSTFEIPKRKGGTRSISAPQGALKLLQHNLANLLYDCREEIEAKRPATPRHRALSHGFRRGQSIFTNASEHKNRRYVLNLDLHDFFPTFNFGRVRGFFMKDREVAVPEKVATVIAQIACYEGSLPQGSPCSPVIADMIAHILDVRLAQLARRHRVTYSRYADDLTFSTNQKEFPAALAHRENKPGSEWQLGAALTSTIERCDFIINPAKTRMQVRASRQMVTGLTVNKKVNVPQDYYRAVRSMCNALFRTGSYHRPIPKAGVSTGASPVDLIEKLGPLEGMLSHVYHIKSQSARRQAISEKDKVKEWEKSDEQSGQKEKEAPIPSEKLYRKFLFYKYFVAPAKPLIVCEGETDIIYLRNALKNLPQFHPLTGSLADGKFVPAIGFFSHVNTQARRIIELTGGSGNFPKFINKYGSRTKKFKHRPMENPVIILIDNDGGAKGPKGIFSLLNSKKFNVTINATTKDPFYHICDNLYLVKTPEGAGDGTSYMETLFSETLKSKLLDGKTFNLDNNHDPAKQYGKVDFAKKIVIPNTATIDWTTFEPLLGRIASVIQHYKASALAKATAA